MNYRGRARLEFSFATKKAEETCTLYQPDELEDASDASGP